MNIHADFSKRALVHGSETEWIPSPMKGVERRMLDRIGDEVARATTIVRYAPGSHFSAHTHSGGEEFIVLEGVFQDEHGDYPAGSYVRNPIGSRHTPSSEDGCTIMVKLWQFDPEDPDFERINMNKQHGVAAEGRSGVVVSPLYQDAFETVQKEVWEPGAKITLANDGGIELFVLEGSLTEAGETLKPWSWLRLPDGEALNAFAGPEGATVWIKTGHLRNVKAPTA